MEGDQDMPARACGKLLVAGPISIPILVSAEGVENQCERKIFCE